MTWESPAERDALSDNRTALWNGRTPIYESGEVPMTTYTIDQIKGDESLLRRLAGEVLNPGPGKHLVFSLYDDQEMRDFAGYRCTKCGATCLWAGTKTINDCVAFRDGSCPIPDPAPGSLADIAEALLRKVIEQGDREQMGGGYILLSNAIEDCTKLEDPEQQFIAWLLWSSADRICCCLAALLPEKVTVGK